MASRIASPDPLSSARREVAAASDWHGVGALPWLAGPLRQALSMANAHALLVHGPAGAGHLAFMLMLAQSLLCEADSPPAPRPCGRCTACLRLQQRSHPDFLLLAPFALRRELGWASDDDEDAPKGETKPSKEVRIVQIRRAIAWSQQSSGRGRGKLLLIHPADTLNLQSANALLKTLEEPPGQLRLVLSSTDPERLLPTLRSRCQRLGLGLPTADQATAWLQGQGLALPEPLLRLCGGSPLQALDWAHDGITAAMVAELPQRIATGDASSLAGQPVPRVVDLLLRLAHDWAALAVGGTPRYFAASSFAARPVPASRIDTIGAWHAALLRTARHAEHPWQAALLVESLVLLAGPIWA